MTEIAATEVIPINKDLADQFEKIAARIRSGDLPATHGYILLDLPTKGEILVHKVGIAVRTSDRLGLLQFAMMRTWTLDEEQEQE